MLILFLFLKYVNPSMWTVFRTNGENGAPDLSPKKPISPIQKVNMSKHKNPISEFLCFYTLERIRQGQEAAGTAFLARHDAISCQSISIQYAFRDFLCKLS